MILSTHGIVGSQIVQFVPTFEFSVKTDNAGVSTSTQFRMPLTTSTGLNMRVDWGDGNIETITNHTLAIHTYASAGTYTISVTGSILGWQFNSSGDRLKILNISQWSGLNISVNRGFFGCTNLTATAIDAPLITTTNLLSYFQNCSNFNGAIGNWDISNVTTLETMLSNASLFNQPLSSWNTSNVVSFYFLFSGATVFNQSIGSWNVSNISTFEGMFYNARNFNNGNSDSIKNWVLSTSKNITFLNMFHGNTTTTTPLFNQPIGSWNTERVTNMNNMFRNNLAFNQDIGNWNVSNVTNFIGFMENKTATDYSAANLDSIYNGWSSRSVQPNESISFGSIKYTAASAAGRLILTSAPNNWTITDGGI